MVINSVYKFHKEDKAPLPICTAIFTKTLPSWKKGRLNENTKRNRKTKAKGLLQSTT